MINKKTNLFIFSWMMSMLVSLNVLAAQEPRLPDTFAEHKIVMQISDPNPFKQTLVLNVAGNLVKYYGSTNMDLEIVAFGPGVRLMLEGNVNTPRIKSLMATGVRFSACENTLTNFTKILGKKPKLIEGIDVVPAGAARIIQLNEAGYKTLKP